MNISSACASEPEPITCDGWSALLFIGVQVGHRADQRCTVSVFVRVLGVIVFLILAAGAFATGVVLGEILVEEDVM